jgi:hypothetical protein
MRTQIRRPLAGLVTLVSLFVVGGCEEGPPSVDTSNTKATVKGVVKIAGVPATEGEITFNPANIQRKDVPAVSAPIGKDGSYTIQTLTGENNIKLGGAIVKKFPIAGRESRSFFVKSGENTFDFETKDSK